MSDVLQGTLQNSLVIILEGINDIARGANPSSPRDQIGAVDVIYGLHQLADRAHERGLVVIGCTMTPIAGRPNGPLSSSLAQAREDSVNHWVRTSGVFDGVADFNAVTRDPAQPDRFLPAYDSGDHLHPNDAGYAAMGNAIDLRLFQPRRNANRR